MASTKEAPSCVASSSVTFFIWLWFVVEDFVLWVGGKSDRNANPEVDDVGGSDSDDDDDCDCCCEKEARERFLLLPSMQFRRFNFQEE